MKGLTDLERSDNSFSTRQIRYYRAGRIKGMKAVVCQKTKHIACLTISNFQYQYALPA